MFTAWTKILIKKVVTISDRHHGWHDNEMLLDPCKDNSVSYKNVVHNEVTKSSKIQLNIVIVNIIWFRSILYINKNSIIASITHTSHCSFFLFSDFRFPPRPYTPSHYCHLPCVTHRHINNCLTCATLQSTSVYSPFVYNPLIWKLCL